MHTLRACLAAIIIGGTTAHADSLTDLMPEPALKAVAAEVSGVMAKRNLDRVTLYHRMRAGDQFDEAADFILGELQRYGYDSAEAMAFPADGQTLFGTQKARPAWKVDFAELWEVTGAGGQETPVRRLGDWAARPLTLAQDSDSADVTAELVDVGAGTGATDYAGKDITGKIVLTSSQPEAVEQLALVERGAAGILSYAANQKSAWWQLDDSLVRWGHMSSFRDYGGFAFMTSLGEARALQARLQKGETVRLHARVIARREAGQYRIVTATLPGSDPKLKDEEIVFSCHLDHPRPGANDNASGCVSILEAARVLKRLVDEGAIPAPKRTIRFLWPSEVEATLVMLNANPELAARLKHVIHMDMVGGGPVTKAVFRVSRGPKSTADISGDIAFAITDFVNDHTLAYASGEGADFALASPEGGREPLLAQKEWLSMGSDHDIFAAGSWRVPVTYLHDWPDRYIHTTGDLAANIDPTKLKRAAFIGVVQAAILAGLDKTDGATLAKMAGPAMAERTAGMMAQTADLDLRAAEAVRRGFWASEDQILAGVEALAPKAEMKELKALRIGLMRLTGATGRPTSGTIYQRNADIKGTMNGFGYSYLEDKLGADKVAALALLALPQGHEIAYEALNYVDGRNGVGDIHDRLMAEFGPVSMEAVSDYLAALASIGVLVGP